MNKIKFQFNIKDLENLSGIKAHTIRIWEKRYQIFNPLRTETNIRFYSINDLQKLLSITYLNNYGYKISRIAELNEAEINELVKQIYSDKTSVNFSINELKIAMLNFDAALFNETYIELIKTKTFSEIFLEVYIPLLIEIGLLWQTNSIKPIHEHFISYLIYQKLMENISLIQLHDKIINGQKTIVLFLPENEPHEISLMFINYQLINKGYKTIYLGSSVPLTDLIEISKFHDTLDFVSYFTISPTVDEINDYVIKFNDLILKNTESKLLVSGNQAKFIHSNYNAVLKFDTLEQLIATV